MADPSYHYDHQEALNRILRILQGNPAASNAEDVLTSDVYSWDEALSRIALLMADQLPGFQFTNPVAARNDYAEIYVWTGTATLTALPTTATKLTGTFQNNALGPLGATPDYANGRITLAQSGYYFVDYQLSFYGSPDVEYLVEPYHAALGIPQAAARVKPYASGSAISMSGHGIFWASGSAEQVDLRVIPDTASSWMIPWAAQLRVYRVKEY